MTQARIRPERCRPWRHRWHRPYGDTRLHSWPRGAIVEVCACLRVRYLMPNGTIWRGGKA